MARTAVITQYALRSRDVQRILQLHAGPAELTDDMHYLVLVPVGGDDATVTEVINHLSLGDLREAWEAATGSDDGNERAEATEALRTSLDLFEQAGARATGALTTADPVTQVRTAVADHDVTELIVVTEPQAVQDILGQDWASRAERELEIPVLHFYSGTDHVG